MWSYCSNIAKKFRLISESSATEQKLTNDDILSSIDILPDECLVQIFSYLDVGDRLRLEAVCQRFQLLSKRSWKDVTSIQITSATTKSVSLKVGESTVCAFVSTIDTNVIRQVLSRCGRYVDVLHIRDDEKLFTNYVICLISEFCHNLTGCLLKLHRSREYSLDVLFALNKKLVDVTITSLSDVNCLRRLSLESVKELMLDFPAATSEVRDSINEILPRCSKLDNLLLTFFNAETVKILSERQRKLRTLALVDDESKNLENAEALTGIAKLKKLERIFLFIPYLTDDVVDKIATKCKRLELVKLLGNRELTKKGLMSIFSLPNLTEIDFHNLPAVTDDILTHIPSTVTSITLGGDLDITDDGIVGLVQRMPNLEFLNIKRCSSLVAGAIHGAVDATKKRENGKVLHLRVRSCCQFDTSKIDTSPLLKIVTYED